MFIKLKFWKKLPAWLKGGIIGVVVALVGIFVLPFLIELSNIRNLSISTSIKSIIDSFVVLVIMPFHVIGLFLTLDGTFGCNFKMGNCDTEMIVGYILTIILFFTIGSYLSWMKNKKKLKLGILTLLLVTLGWIFLFWIIAY